MFNDSEYKRYARHFTLQNFGVTGQQKLKNAKVLCIGCGGLASSAIMYLAAAGIGLLGVIDDDVVDESNLQRQVLFNINDVGSKKVEIAKKRILELNPNIQVKTYVSKFNDTNALEIIENYDLIIDCTDNFYAKYLINDACFERKKPFVYGSIFQFEGQISFFNGKTGPCFRCLFDSWPPPGLIANCAEEGVLGVLPGLVGILQALEVIKYIVGIGSNSLSKLILIDTLNLDTTPLEFVQSKTCPICIDKNQFKDLPRPTFNKCESHAISAIHLKNIINNVTLIDVRNPDERQICEIGGKLIPLYNFKSSVKSLDAKSTIVIYCKSGARSQEAVNLLLEEGFKDVFFLQGGILAWINEINPNLSKY
ncbi:MAG: dinucleotide-utilizing enzyme [Burkholderiales bacterium]|jgi:adenylyltransferase/sulfurtransferase|nr:dinucleotide-utilizing enzyme [Burkholderiales bacterium]